MAVTTSIIDSYENFGRCVKITNGIIEAYVTIDIGPRVIRFGFVGGRNAFYNEINRGKGRTSKDFEDFFGTGKAWFSYGGHRLWITPEGYPETYYPDNDPVEYTLTANGGIFTPPAQTGTKVQLQVEVQMADDKPEIKYIHRVTNLQDTPKEFAIWALSVMDKGGLEIIPQNTNDTGLLSNRTMSFWPYTDLTDSRFYLGKQYITVQQDPSCTDRPAFKIGTDCNKGVILYALDDIVFINRFSPKHGTGAVYPDGGMSFETYTNGNILELETLDEVKSVAPGGTSEYAETWSLAKNPGTPDRHDEAAVDAFVKKVLGE